MGKVKNELQKVFDECYAIYEEKGYSAVIDHVEKQQSENNPLYENVEYEYCDGCDCYMPTLNHECLACGTVTTYFDVVSSGFNEDLLREEIEINAGLYGKILLIKTDVGFIVDVYSNDEHINTMAVYEDELEPKEDEDEEIIQITQTMIEDFLAEWGKSTDLLCNELAYDKEDCDDFLKIDYFWYPFFNNGCWLPIEDGEYDDEAQMIANYLRSTIVS